jgi:hypothetical protein
MPSTSLRIAAGSAVALILAACSSSTPSTAGTGRISFSLATRSSVAAAPVALAAPDSQVVGQDTLVFDSAQIVLRKIDLERSGEDVNCANQPDGTSDGHEDACEEVKAGPSIVDLPLDPGASQTFTVSVDTGTFSQVHFQIHVLTDDPADQALLAQRPEFAGISVRAKGTFNGTDFLYTNDLTANQELEFASPLTVGTAGPVQLTLMVDVHSWFVDGSGNLIDPATAAAGQPNEGIVTQNIRRSFHAFEDENHNGCDDNSEQGDGGHHDGGGNNGGMGVAIPIARN